MVSKPISDELSLTIYGQVCYLNVELLWGKIKMGGSKCTTFFNFSYDYVVG